MNKELEAFNMNRFILEVPEGATLGQVHKLIFGDSLEELVCIVDGHAQKADYILQDNSSISIFRPMGGRTHNPFEGI